MACKPVHSLLSGKNLTTERITSEGSSNFSEVDERAERRRRRSKRRGSPKRSGGGHEKKRRSGSSILRLEEEEEEDEEGEDEEEDEGSSTDLSSKDVSPSSSVSLSQAETAGHSRQAWPTCSSAPSPQDSGPPGSLCDTTTYTRGNFEERFVELDCLGTGGYGTVYAGYRRLDNLPVAIKHVPMDKVARTQVSLDGQLREFPLEVVLLLIVGGQPGATEGPSVTATLLDWFQLDHELVLVMERPVPCMDLFDFIQDRGGYLQEDEAKIIMKQLLRAMLEVHSKKVLHRDIKPENILIETGSESLRLKMLDFGCGCVLREGFYTEFYGTTQYTPPEWYLHAAYKAVPSTVWQLGVLLYDMLCGSHPFNTRYEIISDEPFIKSELSKQCKDLLRRCLAKRPRGRPTLEAMLLHPWLL